MNTLRVYSKVFEGVSEKVRVGMSALIRLDARPSEVYTGKLVKIAKVASSEQRWLSPDVKIFPIEVTFDHVPKGIKPGSTAKVELVLSELPNALVVPISGVFAEQDETYCWKLSGGKPVRTVVEIGQLNETHVQILSGLSEGEKVLLAPPPEADISQAGRPRRRHVTTRKATSQPASQPASRPTTRAASQPTTTQAATKPTTRPATTQPKRRPTTQPATGAAA